MELKRENWIFISIFALLLTVSAALFAPLQKNYVFINNKSDKVAAYIPMVDTAFQIKYTHSIHLSDVLESYKTLPDNTLVATELEYEDFNIGMPSDAGEGEEFVEKDGKYFIKNMERNMPEFRMLVGDVDAGLSFLIQKKELDLKATLERGTSYTFRVQRLSFFQLLKGVNIYEQ
ncbi:DUF1850 domain-containing protein [Planomicrobium sp. CPCC 101079]|uniref:DUF1850 domain-containing protein n=1 Tax=Planomicrobium sp. CPCC 101079 TaxID=2599618 RepID=UPI0011B38E75|nr:DUF1850 domain-containing protein [Planomicrobium sp. CPCC 101079]TWT04829.1 DUF1850 domain-containing protein [Planomicrobium sp. CPCC 101079]